VAAAPTPGPSPREVSTTSRLGHTHTPSDPHITAVCGDRGIPRRNSPLRNRRRHGRVDDDPPEAAQLTGLGEGEGTGRAQMRSAETGRLGERVVAGRRWRWGSHDSLGDGGDGLNRGGRGFGFGRKEKPGVWAFS
jgi:hypothetical protein